MVENETPTAASDSGPGEESGYNQSTAKNATPKDRECQYCHQPFTSSSLGRHLDQYLSKKKPDGIHDVEEIKRLRGGITRRQPKGTHTTKPGSHLDDTAPAKDSPTPIHCSPSAEYLNGVSEAGHVTSLNTPIWQSTGVINGLPDPRIGSVGGTVQAITNTTTLKPNIPSLLNRDPPPEKETARALELALREVLDNIKSASVRTAPKPSPFDFDLQAQTFPSLCLRLLPPPPTLFSPAPFAAAESFPIEPPDASHLEPIRARVTSIIAQWKADHLSAFNSNTPSTTHSSSDPAQIESVARQHTEMATRHIDIAHRNWIKEPHMQRYQWIQAILQAFARERSERNATAERLQRVQEEANQLQSQVEFLNKCQWPREFALSPPSRGAVGSSLGADGVRDLSDTFSSKQPSTGSDTLWDYDALVDKWRRVVRQDSVRTTGVAAQQQQQQLPPSQSSSFSPVNSSSTHHTQHTPSSHHHPSPLSHHHHYHPRPGSASSPAEAPDSTSRSNDLPPAKRPRLDPMSTSNGTRSEETPRPPNTAGAGAYTPIGDRPSASASSLQATVIDTGPSDAPFMGRRTLREVRF